MSSPEEKKGDRFRPRLEQMLNDMLNLRESSVQDRAAVELDQQSVGRLSRMDAIQIQQMALAADRLRQVQVNRIRRSLKQIDDDEFGYCVQCGCEIPDSRLEADPTAYLCLTCATPQRR